MKYLSISLLCVIFVNNAFSQASSEEQVLFKMHNKLCQFRTFLPSNEMAIQSQLSLTKNIIDGVSTETFQHHKILYSKLFAEILYLKYRLAVLDSTPMESKIQRFRNNTEYYCNLCDSLLKICSNEKLITQLNSTCNINEGSILDLKELVNPDLLLATETQNVKIQNQQNLNAKQNFSNDRSVEASIIYQLWPPPKPSTIAVFPVTDFKGTQTLGDIEERIRLALERGEYGSRFYYQIPNGFALATQIEQIKTDGYSENAPLRWNLMAKKAFGFFEYFERLVTSTDGHYRFFLFLVTNLDSDKPRTEKSFEELQFIINNEAEDRIKPAVATIRYTNDYCVRVYCYEFVKPEHAETLLKSTNVDPCESQLRKSKILPKLLESK